MVQNQPKQSRTPRLGNVKNFVRVVKSYLAKYQWTQKDLAIAADMTEAMISRMFRDQNGRGDTFDLTPVMVMKIACALEVGTEGYMQLMEAAYPEFTDALRNKERTMILNINLSEKGKPPLYARYRCLQWAAVFFRIFLHIGAIFWMYYLLKYELSRDFKIVGGIPL